MARRQNLKVSLPLPAGVSVTPEIQAAAESAVSQVIAELGEVATLAEQLQSQGIRISAGELLTRRINGFPKMSSATGDSTEFKFFPYRGKRIVLNREQKQEVIDMLANGAKVRECVEKYGVSSATVNNIKREAGLTNPTEKQKEAFALKKAASATAQSK